MTDEPRKYRSKPTDSSSTEKFDIFSSANWATITIIHDDGKIDIIDFPVNKYRDVIPAVAKYNRELSDLDKRLLGLIAGLCRNTGVCIASNDYLAEKMGVSIKAIEKSLTRLERQGYIFRNVTRKKNRTVRREISINPTCIERYKRTVFDANEDEILSK